MLDDALSGQSIIDRGLDFRAFIFKDEHFPSNSYGFLQSSYNRTKNKEQNKPIRGIFKMKFSKTRTNEYTFEKIAMFD